MVRVRKSLIKTRSLELFFLLAFAIGTPVFILFTIVESTSLQVILLLLGSYAPTIAALVVLVLNQSSNERRLFREILYRWRLGMGWYLVAIILPSAIWLLASGLFALAGRLDTFVIAGLVSFPVVFIANAGEEIGWRGYALPRLLDRMRPLQASIFLGIVWGLFHAAVYWQRPVFLLMTLILLVAISIIFTWMFNRTGGSILLFSLFHAVFNSWGQAFLGAESTNGLYGLVVFLTWLVAAFLILRFGPQLDKRQQFVQGG